MHYDIGHISRQMRNILARSATESVIPIGLAAPQIGIPLRIILVNTTGIPNKILINPVIMAKKLVMCTSRESCLSFPGKTIKLKRAKMIYVEGFDKQWK